MYKDFDFERAKNGDPVVYKHYNADVRPVRLLCFDRDSLEDKFPILGLIKFDNELPAVFDREGNDPSGIRRLFMAPVKREEWVNLYCDVAPLPGELPKYLAGATWQSEQQAKEEINPRRNCVATVKVREWQE